MKSVIPGEAERFKATYAAVASIVTPETLLTGVNGMPLYAYSN